MTSQELEAVAVALHRTPDIHPNILEAPPVVADYAVETDASYATFVARTVIVERVEEGIQTSLAADNHTASNRVAALVGLVMVVAGAARALSDDTFADSLVAVAAPVVDIVLVVGLLKRVLAGTLVVQVHSLPDSVVVGVRRRTFPFGSDTRFAASSDYSTLPPSMPSDPFVQRQQRLPLPPLLAPFSIFHVAFWRVALQEALLAAELVAPSDACVVVVVASSSSDDVAAAHTDSSIGPDTVVVVGVHLALGLVVADRPSLCSLSFGSFVVHNRRLHPFL